MNLDQELLTLTLGLLAIIALVAAYKVAGILCAFFGGLLEALGILWTGDEHDSECPSDAVFVDEIEEDIERPWLHAQPSQGWRPLSRPEHPLDEAHAKELQPFAPLTRPDIAELSVSP